MLSPRWRKVLRDLWRNKSRTVLIVLSVAAGVFSVGVILNTQYILDSGFDRGFNKTFAASASIETDAVDETLLQSLRALPGVTEVDGKHILMTRLSTDPGEWSNIEVTAVSDFDAVRINRFESDSGMWPPAAGEVLIERSALDTDALKNLKIGDSIVVQALDGTQPELRVAGFAYDFNRTPSQGSGVVYAYVSLDTLPLLGREAEQNTIQIVVDDSHLNEDDIRTITDQTQKIIENSGRSVYRVIVPPPGEHPLNGPISALLLLMGVLGAISLLASSFLVFNTLSALLAQQTRQIGVIKALGGRTTQLVGMYLGMTVILSLLALLVAIPLGILGGIAFASFMASVINLDIDAMRIAPHAMFAQIAVGLFIPLVAALLPILSRTRMTVQQAINTYGAEGVRSSLIRRLAWLTPGMSGLTRLSVRNTFRRQGRLIATLLTLALGGMLFVSIMSVRASLFRTLDRATDYRDYDIRVDFAQAYPSDEVINKALSVPGINGAEAFSTTTRAIYNGEESQNISVYALTPSSTMFLPPVQDGRWLRPDDTTSVVINTAFQRDQPEIEVGDTVAVTIEGHNTNVQVVGVFEEMAGAAGIYMNLPAYAAVVGDDDRVNSVWITADAKDKDEAVKTLEKQYAEAGMVVTASYTFEEWRSFLAFHFDIITVFLMVMAVILAGVGGLGLMGTMGINVIERMREIGVLRAVGASNRAILRLIVSEGLVIGVIGWLIGSAAAVLPGKHLSDAVGETFLDVPLVYTFSFGGVLLWMVIALILAALASFVPAYRASRMSVRDVLAYE